MDKRKEDKESKQTKRKYNGRETNTREEKKGRRRRNKTSDKGRPVLFLRFSRSKIFPICRRSKGPLELPVDLWHFLVMLYGRDSERPFL